MRRAIDFLMVFVLMTPSSLLANNEGAPATSIDSRYDAQYQQYVTEFHQFLSDFKTIVPNTLRGATPVETAQELQLAQETIETASVESIVSQLPTEAPGFCQSPPDELYTVRSNFTLFLERVTRESSAAVVDLFAQMLLVRLATGVGESRAIKHMMCVMLESVYTPEKVRAAEQSTQRDLVAANAATDILLGAGITYWVLNVVAASRGNKGALGRAIVGLNDKLKTNVFGFFKRSPRTARSMSQNTQPAASAQNGNFSSGDDAARHLLEVFGGGRPIATSASAAPAATANEAATAAVSGQVTKMQMAGTFLRVLVGIPQKGTGAVMTSTFLVLAIGGGIGTVIETWRRLRSAETNGMGFNMDADQLSFYKAAVVNLQCRVSALVAKFEAAKAARDPHAVRVLAPQLLQLSDEYVMTRHLSENITSNSVQTIPLTLPLTSVGGGRGQIDFAYDASALTLKTAVTARGFRSEKTVFCPAGRMFVKNDGARWFLPEIEQALRIMSNLLQGLNLVGQGQSVAAAIQQLAPPMNTAIAASSLNASQDGEGAVLDMRRASKKNILPRAQAAWRAMDSDRNLTSSVGSVLGDTAGNSELTEGSILALLKSSSAAEKSNILRSLINYAKQTGDKAATLAVFYIVRLDVADQSVLGFPDNERSFHILAGNI